MKLWEFKYSAFKSTYTEPHDVEDIVKVIFAGVVDYENKPHVWSSNIRIIWMIPDGNDRHKFTIRNFKTTYNGLSSFLCA